MSTLLDVFIIATIAALAGVVGGYVALWSLRKAILEDIRAAAAGDKAE